MQMTLNKAYPIAGVYAQSWHYTLVSAMGPLITLLQSCCFYFAIKRKHRYTLYPFLFASVYVETLSGIMNIRNANDLGRIGETLHLGLFTLPTIAVAIHLWLLVLTSIKEKYRVGQIVSTLLWVLLFSSIWILLNNQMPIILL
jgi:hypothetical protein